MKLIATLVGTLPASVRTFLVAQLGKDCYRRLLVEVEPFTGTAGITCTKLAVSKALGMGIVAGGCMSGGECERFTLHDS